MEIHILDNSENKKVKDFLIKGLLNFKIFQAASAYVKPTGLKVINDTLVQSLANDLIVELIVGLDFQITDPDALEQLYQYKEKYPTFNLYCNRSAIGIAYHPKMYIFSDSESVYSLIGSSNLTGGGLSKNKEVNVLINCGIQDDVSSEIMNAFIRLKIDPDLFVPNRDYVDLYRKHHQSNKTLVSINRKMINDFVEVEKSLHHPKIYKRDLTGWMKSVYEVLPEKPFKTKEIYIHESYFRSKYPLNMHIDAKIRQQLQFLRDIGILKRSEDGYWSRTKIES